MFSSILLTTLFAALAAVRADPNPSEPGPNESFNEGQTCHIAWDADTTGTWKTMSIELMTGNNFQMVHLTTVATVDGTDSTNTTFDWICPQVTPNSEIYFYQFTSPNSPSPLWTTRFTIADQNGNSTPPPNAIEPDGKSVPWGIGALVDPSQASPPPTGSSTGSAVVIPPATGSNTASGTSSTSAPASAPTPANTSAGTAPSNAPGSGASPPAAAHSSAPSGMNKVSSPTGSSSGGSTSSTGSSNAAAPTNTSANGAASALNMGSRVTQAVGTLVVVALAYAVAL